MFGHYSCSRTSVYLAIISSFLHFTIAIVNVVFLMYILQKSVHVHGTLCVLGYNFLLLHGKLCMDSWNVWSAPQPPCLRQACHVALVVAGTAVAITGSVLAIFAYGVSGKTVTKGHDMAGIIALVLIAFTFVMGAMSFRCLPPVVVHNLTGTLSIVAGLISFIFFIITPTFSAYLGSALQYVIYACIAFYGGLLVITSLIVYE